MGVSTTQRFVGTNSVLCVNNNPRRTIQIQKWLPWVVSPIFPPCHNNPSCLHWPIAVFFNLWVGSPMKRQL